MCICAKLQSALFKHAKSMYIYMYVYNKYIYFLKMISLFSRYKDTWKCLHDLSMCMWWVVLCVCVCLLLEIQNRFNVCEAMRSTHWIVLRLGMSVAPHNLPPRSWVDLSCSATTIVPCRSHPTNPHVCHSVYL